jgi:cob(I)alamin adenosyltransferase
VKASENGGAAADGDGKQDAITPLRITQDYVDRLERDCDEYNLVLTKLRSFILPGGTPVAAQLHVPRTVARRAERSTWSALDEHGDSVNPLTVKYLNRLSDLLFILSRVASTDSHGGTGDVLWVPGGEHGERDFPKVTVPPLDPDNRKKEW